MQILTTKQANNMIINARHYSTRPYEDVTPTDKIQALFRKNVGNKKYKLFAVVG